MLDFRFDFLLLDDELSSESSNGTKTVDDTEEDVEEVLSFNFDEDDDDEEPSSSLAHSASSGEIAAADDFSPPFFFILEFPKVCFCFFVMIRATFPSSSTATLFVSRPRRLPPKRAVLLPTGRSCSNGVGVVKAYVVVDVLAATAKSKIVARQLLIVFGILCLLCAISVMVIIF